MLYFTTIVFYNFFLRLSIKSIDIFKILSDNICMKSKTILLSKQTTKTKAACPCDDLPKTQDDNLPKFDGKNLSLPENMTEYAKEVGTIMSRHILLYNNKFVFTKNLEFERPLDKEKLGSSTIRNVLFYLDRNGATPMSKVSADLNVDKGNLSRLIENLQQRGYAESFHNAGNRRVLYVKLTKAGYQLIKDEGDTFLKNAQYILRNLTQEEKIDFLNKYKDIVNYMEKL